MVSVIEIVETLTDAIRKNVCNVRKYKLPDVVDETTGLSKLQFVHPAAFPMFVPGKDDLPPGVLAPAPSCVIQAMDGTDKPIGNTRELEIRVSFCTWNPGIHDQEIWYPNDGSAGFWRLSAESENAYTQNMNGWKDVWQFAEACLRYLESNEFIEGIRIKVEDGFEFGPFKTDGFLWEEYPFWSCYISFKAEVGDPIVDPENNDLL